MNRSWKIISALSVIAFLFSSVAYAGGPEVRVKCEKRPDRSRVSVDAKNQNPNHLYSAEVISGDTGNLNMKSSGAPNEADRDVNGFLTDEVSYDFDSATELTPFIAIGSDFIVTAFDSSTNKTRGFVTATLSEYDGSFLVGETTKTVECKVRDK